MREITVNASKKYTVTVTDSWLNLPRVINENAKGKKIAIISDTNVSPLYLDQIKSLISSDYEVISLVVEAGEKSKCIEVYASLLNELAQNAFTRADTLIALGGGVVGDLTAFTASTYMRGITLIAIPTSLLSMIDSSVGGKTAINLSVGKNLCGTFYQPSVVYINVSTLKTLPDKEIQCGKGELVKYAILDKKISQNDLCNYDSIEVISKCVEIKKDIVQADEFESGKRALLNLGHTFGHALEALSNYTLSHGECVLGGLYLILELSKKLYKMDEGEYLKILALLQKIDDKKDYGYSIEDMLTQIAVDKKATFNGVKVVTIKGVGEVEITPLTLSEIRSYFE